MTEEYINGFNFAVNYFTLNKNNNMIMLESLSYHGHQSLLNHHHIDHWKGVLEAIREYEVRGAIPQAKIIL